jgi:AcrR family transcriptional regulator
MARPVDRERRREMAARAFEVVKERGVHKTTMSDLAKALEIKRPTLYWYFPDLSSVFREVYLELQHEVLTHVTEAMRLQSHPIDQLEACLNAAVGFFAQRRDVMGGLLQLWAVGSAERESWQRETAKLLTPQREFMVKLVQHGIDKGQVKPCDAKGLTDTLFMLIDGSNVYTVLEGADPQDMVKFATQHILDPLRIPHKKEEPT